ncbi:MAG: hypothetical protein ACRDT8_22270 [Micromonosporaceae bacterium]
MHDDNREFLEHWCMQVGTRATPDSALLGLAGLCLRGMLLDASGISRRGRRAGGVAGDAR